MYCNKVIVTLLGLFGASRNHTAPPAVIWRPIVTQRPGNCTHLPPSLRPWSQVVCSTHLGLLAPWATRLRLQWICTGGGGELMAAPRVNHSPCTYPLITSTRKCRPHVRHFQFFMKSNAALHKIRGFRFFFNSIETTCLLSPKKWILIYIRWSAWTNGCGVQWSTGCFRIVETKRLGTNPGF